MNAQDLIKISQENERPLKEVLDHMYTQAKLGASQISHFNYMSTERISELGNLGFKVRKTIGPMGEAIFNISWD